MFPPTVWTVVRRAGANDPEAMDRVAEAYRQPVLDFLRAHGAPAQDADDLCQDVFVRVLKGGVLAKADRSRGRFRALLGTVTINVLRDRWRRRRPAPTAGEIESAAPEPDFDRIWALHLVERALRQLEAGEPESHAVLAAHLDGAAQPRKRLWRARRKLASLVRREVALTCRSHEEVEEELAVLAPWLGEKKGERGPAARE